MANPDHHAPLESPFQRQELEQIADEILHSLATRLEETEMETQWEPDGRNHLDLVVSFLPFCCASQGCSSLFPQRGLGDNETVRSWKHGPGLSIAAGCPLVFFVVGSSISSTGRKKTLD